MKLVVRGGVALVCSLPRGIWLRVREASGLVRRLDYARHPIYLRVDSWIENDVRLHSCAKEPGTVDWIETWFRPGEVFYDIGACVGAYSLVAYRFLGGAIRVYAFEPGFVTFPQLCQNIRLNLAQDAIVPVPVALSDRTGLFDFCYQNLSTGGALHALETPVNQDGRPFAPIFRLPALSYRLDEFVSAFGLPKPNHVKIDVDGGEMRILHGAERTLSDPALRSLLLEVNQGQGNFAECEALLTRSGFVLHSVRNENRLYYRPGPDCGEGG